MRHFYKQLIAFFVFLYVFSAPPVFALDTNAFLQSLEQILEADGAEFEYARKDSSANGLQLFGVKLEHKGRNELLEIDTLTFSNPEQSAGGNVTYDALLGSALTINGKDGGRVEIVEMSAQDLEFSIAPDSDPFPEVVGNLEFADISIFPPDANGGSISIPSITATGYERTGLRTFFLGSAEISPFQGRGFDPEGEPVDISSEGMTVRNIEHFGNFGVSIEALDVGAINVNATHKHGPLSLSFEGMRLENYYTWDGSDETRPLIPEKDVTVTIYPLELTLRGEPVLTWDGGEAFADNDEENQITTSTASFKNLTLDLGAVPFEGREKQNIQPVIDLGYEKISANIAMGGYIDLKNGILEIGKLEFDILNAGRLNMKFRVNGYTEEVARSIALLGRDIGAETDPQLQQEKSMQMLAMLTPLSLEDLEVSVADDSLLNKVVSLQATRLNQEPEQVAGIVAPMAGIMLAPFNVPEFAASVSQALTVFMQGNKTIRARMEPRGGLAITEMIALGSRLRAGLLQPKELIDRLKVSVDAE